MANSLSTASLQHKKTLRDGDQKWLENRLKVADTILSLSNSVDIETTYDAEIILFCVLSAISATVWPGAGIDQARYIQLLVDYCPITPTPRTVSIGALLNSNVTPQEREQILCSLWKFDEGRVVQAREVDVSENVVTMAVPSLGLDTIRKSSYAHIIYTDFRSALVHQYELSSRVTDWSLFNNDSLHYSNVQGKPRLFIPYAYLKQVVKTTVEAVFDKWHQSATFERAEPQPATWWIKG